MLFRAYDFSVLRRKQHSVRNILRFVLKSYVLYYVTISKYTERKTALKLHKKNILMHFTTLRKRQVAIYFDIMQTLFLKFIYTIYCNLFNPSVKTNAMHILPHDIKIMSVYNSHRAFSIKWRPPPTPNEMKQTCLGLFQTFYYCRQRSHKRQRFQRLSVHKEI